LLPVAREFALTVKVATPLLPDAASVPVPRIFVPRLKVTLPVGAVVPLAGFTIAVSVVLAVLAILAGLAETVVAVATGGIVTVTVAVPLDAVNALPAPKVAVTVLLPVARELALTVKVATPLLPDAASVPVPRVFAPRLKVTLPVGAVVPLAGFTVAVSFVLAVVAMLIGLAETAVVVATAAPVTVTTAVATEPLKVALPP
jgi:hypothetical protein